MIMNNYKINTNRQFYWNRVFPMISIICISIWTLTPILWAVSASFKDSIEIYTSVSLLPKAASFAAYRQIMHMEGFWRWAVNSIFVAVVITIITMILSILAAYGFSHFTFRFKGLLLVLFIVPRLIPRVSLVIPLFEMIWRLGLLDTYGALILTYTASAIPFSVWLMYGFFSAVPKSVEEAAEIDGANLWSRLIYVILPVSWPGVVTAIIFCIRDSWNEFPFVLSFITSSDMRTLPYALYSFRDAQGIENWAAWNAFTILSIMPLIVLFIIFQRRIVGNLMAGAIK